jgi:hypothetical protein
MEKKREKFFDFIGGVAQIERLETKSLFKGQVGSIFFPDEGGIEIGLVGVQQCLICPLNSKEWFPFSPESKFYVKNYNFNEHGDKVILSSPRINVVIRILMN